MPNTVRDEDAYAEIRQLVARGRFTPGEALDWHRKRQGLSYRRIVELARERYGMTHGITRMTLVNTVNGIHKSMGTDALTAFLAVLDLDLGDIGLEEQAQPLVAAALRGFRQESREQPAGTTRLYLDLAGQERALVGASPASHAAA